MADAQATDAELTFQKGDAIGFGDIGAAGLRLAHQFVGQRRQALRHISHLTGNGGGRFTAAGQRLQGRQIQRGEIGMRPVMSRRRGGHSPITLVPVWQGRFGPDPFISIQDCLSLVGLNCGSSRR
jgi:hypothetical protein